MSVESLNNFLKTNQLRRKTKVTTEKLLDTLEELVDIKMWHRILSFERPNAANYQDRVVIKAHKKAEVKMKDGNTTVTEVGFG
jgi:DNA-binding HxlR family transcriptional regulator